MRSDYLCSYISCPPSRLRLGKGCLIYRDIKPIACYMPHDMELTSFPLPLLYIFSSLFSISICPSLDYELGQDWSLALIISKSTALSLGPSTDGFPQTPWWNGMEMEIKVLSVSWKHISE